MANYNVDIALQVKNLNQLKLFRTEIDQLAKKLDEVQKLSRFDGRTVKERVRGKKEEVKLAKDQLELEKQLFRAQKNRSAEALRSQRLIVQQRRRGLSQFSGPIGPGQASPAAQAIGAAQQIQKATNDLTRLQRQKEIQITALEVKNDDLVFRKKLNDIEELGRLEIKTNKAVNDQDLRGFDNRLKNREARSRRSAQTAQADRKRLGNIGTGIGFPLLMGGGPAQALAGGIGGAVGGLGGSIIASAAVAQLQLFAEEIGKVGQAVSSVSGAFEFMSDKALFSNDQIRLNAEALIEQGESAKAARLMTQELSKVVGQSGIKALKDFGEEAKTLGKLVNTLILRFQAFMAEALMPMVSFLNRTLKGITDVQAFEKVRNELTGPRKQEFESRLKELGVKETIGAQGTLNTSGLTDKIRAKMIQEFPLEGIKVPGGQITPDLQDLANDRDILSKSNKQDKTAKERARKLEESEKLANSLAKQIEFLRVGSEIDRKRLEVTYEYVENLDKIFELGETIYTNELRQSALDVQRLQNLQIEVENSLKLAGIKKNINEIAEEGIKIFNSEDDGIGFGAGMDIQLLAKQEEAIDKILEKYPMIGEAASAAAGVVTLGVNEMINGTKSVEEVFSDFLKSIGDMLIQAAQQMIAQYIAIGIAKMFAGLGSSGIDSFGGGTPAAGAFTPGGTLSTFGAGFAEGGYVTGPTNAVVGEGGEPEYIIPESKMRESMGRYSRGSRGGSVIPAEGGGAAGTEGGTAVASAIDVRFKVERINSVDYVTAAEFQQGLQQAAKQGAQRGEQQTIKRLQMSSGTRKRLGL